MLGKEGPRDILVSACAYYAKCLNGNALQRKNQGTLEENDPMQYHNSITKYLTPWVTLVYNRIGYMISIDIAIPTLHITLNTSKSIKVQHFVHFLYTWSFIGINKFGTLKYYIVLKSVNNRQGSFQVAHKISSLQAVQMDGQFMLITNHVGTHCHNPPTAPSLFYSIPPSPHAPFFFFFC